MIACAFTFRGSEISTASIFREDELEPCKKATLEMVWLDFLKLDSIQLSQCHPKCLSTSRSSICASGITRYQAVKYSQSKSPLLNGIYRMIWICILMLVQLPHIALQKPGITPRCSYDLMYQSLFPAVLVGSCGKLEAVGKRHPVPTIYNTWST